MASKKNPDVPVEVIFTSPSGPDLQNPVEEIKEHLSETSLQQEHYLQNTEVYDDETFLKLAKAVLETEGVNYEEWKAAMMNRDSDDDYIRTRSNSGTLYSDSAHSSYYYSDSDDETGDSSGYYYDDSSEGEDDDEEEKAEKVPSTKSSSEEELPKSPLMGMKSFRNLETKVLVKYMTKSDDERMHELRRKLKQMRKVDPPRLYKFKKFKIKIGKHKYKTFVRAVDDTLSDTEVLADKNAPTSKTLLQGGQAEFGRGEEGDEDEEEEDAESYHSSEHGKYKYTKGQWAMMNTLSFLRKLGCPPKKESEVKINLEDKKLDAKIRAFLGEEGPGRKRRDAIPTPGHVPEITDSMRRQAERTFLRTMLDNSRPKFPLARFILPQYRYKKKVEQSMVGPGSYEIDSLYNNARLKRLRSMPSRFKSCSSRFPVDKSRPPACDAISNSWAKWEIALDHYKHPGKVTMFESAPCNFRNKGLVKGYGSVAPNHYKIKSSIQELLDKRVSKEKTLFESGNFDTCQELLPDPGANMGPGTYEIRSSFVKELEDTYGIFKGKMSETPREKMFGFKEAFVHPLWPVKNDLPGPAAYTPYQSENLVQEGWAPFGTSAKCRKPIIDEEDPTLACCDYYLYANSIKGIKEERKGILGEGWKFNFDSKTPQITPDEKYVGLQIRNKALNHKLDQEVPQEKAASEDPPCFT